MGRCAIVLSENGLRAGWRLLPGSGRMLGPEASWWVFVVIALLFAVFWLTPREARGGSEAGPSVADTSQ
jgi:hypothetical protein